MSYGGDSNFYLLLISHLFISGFEYGDTGFSMYGGMDGNNNQFGNQGGFMQNASQDQTTNETKEDNSRV